MKRIIALIFLCLTCSGLTFAQEGEKKNILFIAVDDLKPLLSNYGETQMKTPNFDRLAKMGITFTNAHVQYAVCGPSRASVMTGTYPDRTKVWDLHSDFRKTAPDLISMPEYLISQGYETTGIGKIYHKGSSSEGHDGKSWSIPHVIPEDYDPAYGEPAMNTYQNPETKAKMEKLAQEFKDKNKKGWAGKYVFNRLKPSTESADVSDEAYQDGVYTKEALEKLRMLNKGSKPFFLAVGYQRPHLPFVAPQKYWDMYDRDKIELAEFQDLAENTPMIAYHNFGELRSYTDIDNDLDVGDKISEAKQRELIHGYYACVSYIDAQLGKLLDELDELGITENTVIALWGDHGFHLGDHTEWCKHSNFEQATRIPLMFAGPGVEKNIISDQPVELLDMFPTLFELANVKNSDQAEGISLVPLMDGDDATGVDKDYAISQYGRGGKDKDKMGYTIRTDKYRYTEWYSEGYRSYDKYDESLIVGKELYDYEKDPNETKSFIGDKKYNDIQEDLQEKLQDHLENLKEDYNE